MLWETTQFKRNIWVVQLAKPLNSDHAWGRGFIDRKYNFLVDSNSQEAVRKQKPYYGKADSGPFFQLNSLNSASIRLI